MRTRASSRCPRSASASGASAGVEETRSKQPEQHDEDDYVDGEHTNVQELGRLRDEAVAEHHHGVQDDYGQQREQERVRAKAAGVLAPGDLDRSECDRGDPGEQERAP